MSKQQTTTRGKQSTAQKMDSSRHGFNPIPATSKVNGAFGDREPTTQHTHDAAMHHAEKERTRERLEGEQNATEDDAA